MKAQKAQRTIGGRVAADGPGQVISGCHTGARPGPGAEHFESTDGMGELVHFMNTSGEFLPSRVLARLKAEAQR